VGTCVDTSALFKRYLHEPRLLAFNGFAAACEDESAPSPVLSIQTFPS
jgi:hypothetical protein